jgi:hypothetical protein
MPPSAEATAHDHVESLPTMKWNGCPRSRGTSAHDRWNAHTVGFHLGLHGLTDAQRALTFHDGEGDRHSTGIDLLTDELREVRQRTAEFPAECPQQRRLLLR